MSDFAKIRIRCVASLLTVMACAISSVAAAPASQSYASAISAFQSALFRSTLDRDGFGGSAIDLYWTADAMRGFDGPPESFDARLSDLYAEIPGGHIVRAQLTASGWKITPSTRPLILARGQSCDVLLLVSNATGHGQSVAARLRGSTAAWNHSIELRQGQTIALVPRVRDDALGTLHSVIELQAATTASIPIPGEVHAPVHLQLTVRNAAGRLTPARVYVHSADGRSYSPTNSFDRIMWMTGEHFFYTPGQSELVLPAGIAEIEVRKGFEYLPVKRRITLAAEHMNRVDVRLAWLRDMASKGWYSGDDHIHNNYTGDPWSTPEDARLVVAAEGLHVGNMMVSNGTGDDLHDERYFEGKLNSLSTLDELLYWNQEMRSWSYGHLVLLGLKSLVRPIYTGFPGTPNWEDYPSNDQQAEQAHRNGGIAVYAHPALRFGDFPTGSLAAESVVDVALGAIDDFEVFCSHDEPSMELWYRFLNLGFHVGIAGGSDAFLNQQFSFLAGGERVYVYTGRRLTYAAWIDGLKRGRTFATVGPLLTFTVDGRTAGSELRFANGQNALLVRVSADSSIPMTRVEIVVNGAVVATEDSLTPNGHLQWSGKIPVSKSSWIAARIWGPDNERIANGPSRWSQRRSSSRVLLAHSGPVYVSIGGRPVFSDADRDFCLRWIDALTAQIEKQGKFADATHRSDVLASFARARRIYQQMGSDGQGGESE